MGSVPVVLPEVGFFDLSGGALDDGALDEDIVAFRARERVVNLAAGPFDGGE